MSAADLAALRAVVQRAVEELDARHERWLLFSKTIEADFGTATYTSKCRHCSHRWPCPSKLVADELRQALGDR